ncbi:MAG TPA: hypothetical protein DCO79_13125 [Spirochaeta sp.]|nr:hypothetical protein [Spirochaeta sp.]
MEIETTAKELLERYLKAVARQLPLSKRADISKEIESMVFDICEERYGNAEIGKNRMESVLLELGKPSRLAAKYKEDRPLIGPELMPIFKLVILIVCVVTIVVSLIDFALSASGMSAVESGLFFLDLFSSLTGAVGTIFIIFVILERVIKNKAEIDFDDDKWKISDLPEIKEKIPSRAEIVATLIFSTFFIVALNLFIDRIGIYNFLNGSHTFTPILTEQIKSLLPMFSVRIAIGAVVLLPFIAGNDAIPAGKRNYYHQISQMGLVVFDIGILILLLSRGIEAFFILDGFRDAGIEDLIGIISKVYNGILILLLALSCWSLVKRTLVILPKGRV